MPDTPTKPLLEPDFLARLDPKDAPMSPSLALPRLILLFCILSGLDVVFTCLLLTGGRGNVIEANPIADYWLIHFGLVGLAGFKVMVVLCVIGLCEVIRRHRQSATATVYVVGCSILTLVDAYSLGRIIRMLLES